jgi:hypothetical protein
VPDRDKELSPPTKWSARFPELYDLFATYLVESWKDLYGTPDAALREGIDDRTVDEVRALISELGELLALDLDEGELRHLLFRGLGSYYIPSARTCTEWLEEVARQLDDAIHARTANGG